MFSSLKLFILHPVILAISATVEVSSTPRILHSRCKVRRIPSGATPGHLSPAWRRDESGRSSPNMARSSLVTPGAPI